MSNVVSPRGPLPPRVYWRRRMLLGAVVLGVVVLIGRLFGGGDDTREVADRVEPRATAQPQQQTGAGAAGHPPAAGGAAARPATSTARMSGPTGPLAQPVGPCAVSDVAVVPDVEDTDAFGPVPLRVGLSTTGAQACTFAFGPESVALRVTSGDDLIWESLSCASAIEPQQVVVRPGWLSYVTVDWNGRRVSEGCADDDFAQPGYYWAEAAAIGGEPGRSQFELQTPASPEPKPQPAEQPSAQPSDEPSQAPTQGSGARSGDERSGSAAAQESDAQESDAQGGSGADASGQQQEQRDEPIRARKAGG